MRMQRACRSQKVSLSAARCDDTMLAVGHPSRRIAPVAVDRQRFAQLTVVVLVATLLMALLPATPAEAADSRTVERIQTILERKINYARTSRGLKPLRVNRKLEYWATDHARYLARNRVLVHDSMLRLRLEAPARAITFSENIGYNSASNAARRAHYLFMRSAGHRANILHRSSTHMGIGVVKRGGYTYIVERFVTLP